jgi:hypothetical protein
MSQILISPHIHILNITFNIFKGCDLKILILPAPRETCTAVGEEDKATKMKGVWR